MLPYLTETKPTQGPTSSRARHTTQILQQCRNTPLSFNIEAAQSYSKSINVSTHSWSLHSTPERRNPALPIRTPTKASLTKKPWQATDTTQPTARKRHNKENSTNSQNIERPHQTQQYNQDEETEEYPAGKGTEEMPTKSNKGGRDRESTWERILNIDSENDPKSWNQNGIIDK